MRNLIWKVKPDVCVEIGVFAGKSLINTALALKENGKGIVYGIDPWRLETAIAGSSPDEFDWNNVDLDAVHYDCVRAIWQHDLEKYAVLIRSASQHCWRLFERHTVDILYIDGGHSEESSCSDTINYAHTVRPGGHLWLDDTNYESLQKAIRLIEPCFVLVKDFGHCRLYRKNK